jgi:hypothetical protein
MTPTVPISTAENKENASRVRFNRDIKPILAETCFACHGPDRRTRKGNLRLDLRASAITTAIVPGNSQLSPLLARVASHDSEDVMPPPGSKRERLSAVQVDLLRRWIDEGAAYEPHWAFIPPERPQVPVAAGNKWVRNPVDAFLARGHEQQGLVPAPQAKPASLFRRLCLDLNGLPPSPEEVSAFLEDRSPYAYEKAVDRLLDSPHLGERMAVFWLDLVRYADTDGYSIDTHREAWLYRDYVIEAFNRNVPFDRFTLQQLCGDLLPHNTRGHSIAGAAGSCVSQARSASEERTAQRRENLIASGYNRLLMTSQEGCADPRDYIVRYAADRVKNLSAVWLGLTLGCAECHDHKFDPFTSRDFYRLAAFFADIQEKGTGRQEATRLPSPEQEARLVQLETEVARGRGETAPLNSVLPVSPDSARRRHHSAGAARLRAATAVLGLLIVSVTVWLCRRGVPQQRSRLALAGLVAGLALLMIQFPRHGMRSDHQRNMPEPNTDRRPLKEVEAERDALQAAVPNLLVSQSGRPREVRVLPRGDWTNQTGEVVEPGVPESLALNWPGALDSSGRMTRLDLARWLLARDNPLVARVFVNRLWKLAFGVGLVRGDDDFGTRGTAPTHSDLLDWLAVEFIDSGWDVKGLLRLLVTSSAYRQGSNGSRETMERDPDNRWLARQNRFRLDAEFVRDYALAVGGLLSNRVGGPSVKPYQPDGFWTARFTEKEYRPSQGEDQYRRGVYTYWCRTFPHPSLQAFDTPSRQLCTANRDRSATPAQALVLLNDPTYAEAARALAARILRSGGPTSSARLHFAFQLVLARPIRPPEEEILTRLVAKHMNEYNADRGAANQVLQIGSVPLPTGMDVAELAAWTSVARALLNLQETTTRD